MEYLPKPRNHSFEFICYLLEQGTFGGLIINLLPTYILYSLFFSGSYFNFIILYILIPLICISSLIAVLFFSSKYESNKVWNNNQCKKPDWTNTKHTNIIFNDKSLLNKYKNKKIPIESAVELYINNKIDFIDTKAIMINRYNLFTFVFTLNHIKWFLFSFLGELTGHTTKRDAREVGDVYNRGNDFYQSFLGKTMVYTSGIFTNPNYITINNTMEHAKELDDAQYRKIDIIFKSIHLREGDTLLDIGCGWGSLVIRAAMKYGANAFGCTLAEQQIILAKQRMHDPKIYNLKNQNKIKEKIHWIINDYRQIPFQMNTTYKHYNIKKFDKITCIEMAEHVGIKNFESFLKLIHSILEDDGFFYLQIGGIRRTWSYEDLIFYSFMGKYVVPGADASTPINWVINQLERSGFEIHRMENCGSHYARTLEMWHDNWISNKTKVISSYNEWWYRLWDIFLSWATVIARQGSGAVYMITAHKNLLNDQHSINVNQRKPPKLNRTRLFIGNDHVSYQQ